MKSSYSYIKILFLFFLIVVGILTVLTCQKPEKNIFFLSKVPDSKTISADSTRWHFSDFLQQVDSLNSNELKMALVDSFMNYAAQYGFPWIEDSTSYFLFRGTPKTPFSVAGDFNSWSPGVDLFTGVSGTDLFYLKKTFPMDARLDYKFVMGTGSNALWLLDPLNPFTVSGGFGPNSELQMPQWEYPWEIDFNPDVAQGNLIQIPDFRSNILNNSRSLWVYLPSQYSTEDTVAFPAIYVNDGGDYLKLGKMKNVLDNLIAANIIRPVVAVFINPVNRNAEYWLNDQYLRMLVEELVPYIQANYRCLDSPDNRAIMGASLGGVISLYAGYKYPDVFGLVAGQSSAIQINNQQIKTLFQSEETKPLKIYLDWGSFESLAQYHPSFVNLLRSKGYRLTYRMYNEGHSWGNWRAHIDEILKYFWKTQVTGIFTH